MVLACSGGVWLLALQGHAFARWERACPVGYFGTYCVLFNVFSQSQVKELEHKLIAAHHAAVKAEQQQQQQMMQQQRLQQAQPSGLSSRRSVAASPGELEGAMAGAGVLSPRATSTAAAVVVGRPQAVSRTASVAGSMDPREVSVFQRAMSPGLSMRTSSTARK